MALLAMVLMLHALLLGRLVPGAGPGWRSEPPRPVQVRQIERPQALPAAQPRAGEGAARAVAARPPTARPRERQSPERAAAQMASMPAPLSMASIEELPNSDEVIQAVDPGGLAVPVYSTQRPPPITLLYEVRRGAAVGQSELAWRPSELNYRLTLLTQIGTAPSTSWASVGGFDPAGLAPLRFTESRRGRELRAANFQRDSGRLSFSGPAVEHPLVAGGQDRLSWMVQLAAVMAANPALAEADAQISIWVAGARGDAEVWTFTVQGTAALDLPIGPVSDVLHLLREPRRPYDTQVQVWLDPSRHFLPVQAWLRVRATGLGTELRLQDLK